MTNFNNFRYGEPVDFFDYGELLSYLYSAIEETTAIARSLDGFQDDYATEFTAHDQGLGSALEAAQENLEKAAEDMRGAAKKAFDSAGDIDYTALYMKTGIARGISGPGPKGDAQEPAQAPAPQEPTEGTTAPLRDYYHRKAEEAATEKAVEAATE